MSISQIETILAIVKYLALSLHWLLSKRRSICKHKSLTCYDIELNWDSSQVCYENACAQINTIKVPHGKDMCLKSQWCGVNGFYLWPCSSMNAIVRLKQLLEGPSIEIDDSSVSGP